MLNKAFFCGVNSFVLVAVMLSQFIFNGYYDRSFQVLQTVLWSTFGRWYGSRSQLPLSCWPTCLRMPGQVYTVGLSWSPGEAVIMVPLSLLLQLKCHQYWPSEGNRDYGHVNVSLDTTITLQYYVIRSFKVTHVSKPLLLMSQYSILVLNDNILQLLQLHV